MSASETELQEQIDHLTALIAAYRTAQVEFVANGAQKVYVLDTGQSRIRVERLEPEVMAQMIDSFINQRQVMRIRIGECRPGVYVRPRW